MVRSIRDVCFFSEKNSATFRLRWFRKLQCHNSRKPPITAHCNINFRIQTLIRNQNDNQFQAVNTGLPRYTVDVRGVLPASLAVNPPTQPLMVEFFWSIVCIESLIYRAVLKA